MKIKFFVFAFVVSTMLLSHPLWAQKTGTRISSSSNNDAYIDMEEDGHTYKIRLNGTTVKEVEIDGKIIPASEHSKYDDLVKRVLKQMEEDRRQAALDRKQAEKDRAQADKDREQAELDRRQADKDRKQADKDRAQAEKDRLGAEDDRKQADKDRAQADKDRAQAELDRIAAEKDRKLYEQMITELISDKLLENRSALTSLTLDNKEFSINGVKQSDAVQQKYAARYLKGKNSSMRVNYSQ